MAASVNGFLAKKMIENYKKICREDRTEPNEGFLQQLSGIDAGNVVCNLSTVNMCVKTCRSLGKFLSTDTNFTELLLTDCLLQEEALRNLLERIVHNNSIVTLDLKGNNVKIEVGQALGAFLKFNRCLRNLILEWNNIGVYPEVVAAICEGLASNMNLQELVLRNNQISHVGVDEIAHALKKNSNLKILGTEILSLAEALKINRSLIQLDLNGNNISIDTLNSIERALKYNCEHKMAIEEQKRREDILKMGLRRAEEEASGQVNQLMSKLSLEQQKTEQIHRYSSSTITNLQNVLDDRLTAIKSLEAKLESMEKSLYIKDKQIKDLEDHLVHSKQEISDLRQQHLNILRQERDNHSEREEVLLGDIRKLRQDQQDLNLQIKLVNEKSQSEQEKTAKIWEELLNRSKETMHEREEEFKKQMADEKAKMSEKLSEWLTKEREFEDKRRADQIGVERRGEKIKMMETELKSLRDDLNESKTRAKMERKDGEERELKIQLKYEEIQKIFASTSENLTELRAKYEKNLGELERRREETANLQSKLISQEENERILAQLRRELNDAYIREREMRINDDVITTRMKKLEQEMMDLENKKNNLIKQKDDELSNLKETHQRHEEHRKMMAEKEQQRIDVLHSAITAYLKST
uniref:Leucine-rich repeat-containing protein 45 n=1 Tax=Strigamia maritima TaxID=126957 RepID=T1JAG1_STRMM